MDKDKLPPGSVRDAIIHTLSRSNSPLKIKAIHDGVERLLGPTPASSVRSYLRLNTPELFVREQRGRYTVNRGDQLCLIADKAPAMFRYRLAILYLADCIQWLTSQSDNSFHAVVTDPPYGLHEYTPEEQTKLRNGRGGVWRIPPSYDGHKRSPLPRFTTLSDSQLSELGDFFQMWGKVLLPKIVPGAHVIVASNPLLSFIVSQALYSAGFERRGEIIRLTMTMRGGDRPKHAHREFRHISVMPRSMWEPWLVYRKPPEGRIQDNLRKWKTGGFRRPSEHKPFGDVIRSSPTRKSERDLAQHPSLKPQQFLRQIVRAVLPVGQGIVLDPFAGSGSTLAACNSFGYESVGVEMDATYFEIAKKSIPKLTELKTSKAE